MALKLKIKNPRNPREEIDSYIRLRSIMVDLNGYGELSFEIWKNKESRNDSQAKPYTPMFSIAIGDEEIIHGDQIMKFNYQDIKSNEGGISIKKVYKELRKQKRKWGNEILDFINSEEI